MIATVTLNPAFDRTIYVDQLACGDTNRITRTELDAGGKGVNASRMLAVMGAETVALGFLGGATGRFIQQVLTEGGVKTDFTHTAAETRTNIDIQTSDGTPPTTLNERGGPIEPHELEHLKEQVRIWAGRCRMMIFGGSIPDGVDATIYRELIEIAQAEGSKAVLDADNQCLTHGLEARPMMIKPNIEEAKRLVGMDLQSPEDVSRAAKQLVQRGIELVVVSMGRLGAVAATASECWHAVPPNVEAVSTVGSGDSMVAGICCALAGGGSLSDSLALGSAAGAATAMSSGVEMGRKEDIDRLLPLVTLRGLD